jgi:hypothetical protein
LSGCPAPCDEEPPSERLQWRSWSRLFLFNLFFHLSLKSAGSLDTYLLFTPLSRLAQDKCMKSEYLHTFWFSVKVSLLPTSV